METIAQPVISVKDFTEIFKKHIQAYRQFEKMPYKDGFGLIKDLFRDKSSLASHLCDHWKWKKKDFGVFWLNLDYNCQVIFYNHWGLGHSDNDRYLQDRERSEMAELFAPPPFLPKKIYNIHVFFNNHGIGSYPELGIKLENLPPFKKRYGNSRNWGDYLLSLPVEMQEELIGIIDAKKW